MSQRMAKPETRLQLVPLIVGTSTRPAVCYLCGRGVEDDQDITVKMTIHGPRFYCRVHL